jgi:alpha-N-arabinofuranosidase
MALFLDEWGAWYAGLPGANPGFLQQQNTLRDALVASPEYRLGEYSVPAVHGSAVRGMDGKVYMALTNLDPNKPSHVTAGIRGIAAKPISGRVLTAPSLTAHNSFDKPDEVKPAGVYRAKLRDGTLEVQLPPRSVVMLQLN